MIQIQNDQAKVQVRAKKSKASKVIIDAKPGADGVFKPAGWEDGETFSWAWNFETESAPGTASPHTGRWKGFGEVTNEVFEAMFGNTAQGVYKDTSTDKTSYEDILGIMDAGLSQPNPTIKINIKNAGQVKKDIEELQKRLGESIDKSLDDQIRKMFGLK